MSIKNRSLIGSAFIAIVLLAVPAADARNVSSERGAVVGVVFDDVGAPLPGALVSIAGPTVADPQKSAGMGFFHFANLAAGEYTVNVSHPNFAPVVQRVVVHAGATADIGIQLRAAKRTSLRPSGFRAATQ